LYREDLALAGLRGWIESLSGPVLRSLTANAPDAIFVLDLDERIQFINWAAGGLTVEGVIGTQAYEYVPVEQRAAMRECFDAVRRTHKPGSYQNVYTNPVDGNVSFWESRVAPVLQQGEVLGLVVISSDVTERREAAAQRELLFSLSLDMLCIAGFDGYFKRINPAFQKTLQYSLEELLSRPFIELVHPDDVAKTLAATHALNEGKDVVDFENRFRRKDGEYRTLSWRSTGEPVSKIIVAVARDVTEQRALDLQLRQSQKMDAVGQLAGGLAHDFNNLLLAILINTEAAQQALGKDHPLAGHLADVSRASERASDLVKQLLAFGRRRPSCIAPLELNRALADISMMVRRLIPENVEIERAGEREAVVVEADPGQLEQVLLNLCLNARDAMPGGGRLTISTETLLLDEGAGNRMGLMPGPYAAIHVVDTGAGIASEFRDRIFEPFFTTKSPGKGTGLGLATAYAIIKQHSGILHFESEPGAGSRFSVYLPRSKAAESGRRDTSARRLQAGLGTVLVAEDEDLVRTAVTNILESAGYTVLGARDGVEAIELLDAGSAVQLVLLDVVMPRMGGPQTLACIRERWPELKVILSSGYRDGPGIDSLPVSIPLLEKPYRAEDLLELVHAQLSSDSTS
jgi:PAS domain S-box-containing protein